MVGVFLCFPQLFRFRDQSLIILMSSSYYVASEQRGRGLSLFMKYLRLGSRFPLVATTANEQSVALLDRFDARPIPGTDHELIGVVRWRPMVEEWIQRRIGWKRPARLAAAAGGPLAALWGSSLKPRTDAELRVIESARDLEAIGIPQPEQQKDCLTADRGIAFLRWRYFGGADATRRLFVVRFESGQECMVAAKLRRRGYREQIRALSVMDLWGRLPQDGVHRVLSLLAAHYQGRIDLVSLRGQPEQVERRLLQQGFLRRDFPNAVGWFMDPAGLLPTKKWYLTPADGDAAV